MRVWLLGYGVFYVVLEIVGHSLESVGWGQITALDVATAVTDAFLTVSVTLAALLAVKLGAERWGPSLVLRLENGQPVAPLREKPIGVRSWRPEPRALLAAPAPAPSRNLYSVGAYDRRPRRSTPAFPEEPGRLL